MSSVVEAVGAPLVWTKLNAPIRRELVSRPALRELLSTRPPPRLILVRAPAGWGKSTLLADWHATPDEARSFAWLALDREDDEPVRFWLYVVEAFRTVEPAIGTTSLPVLHAPGISVVDDFLPVLVNELATLIGETALILDDYHLVANPKVHEGTAFLVQHLPPTVTLVLSTRVEPPLPLARLRGRGELVEIDVDDLRFSEAEAGALLNELHGIGLDAASVASLCERTEGWAAGLYLAALSLRHNDDARAFVRAFAGDDRHVVDYLTDEVLAGQDAEARDFLLRTSILDRLCAPLCDAVTGATGSAALLARIERSNLFLVPLDARRDWYRYHHLFAELLRHELRRGAGALVPELHRRAAGWLLAAGHVSEAIHHTIAAGDFDEAGELVAEHWALTLLGSAGDSVIDEWLRALPAEAVRADLRLCVARCFVGLSRGRMDDVQSWLAAAEAAPLPRPFLDGFASARGAIACVRAAYLWETGDVAGAMSAGREAKEAEAGSPWEAIGVAVIGLAHAAVGEWEQGQRWAAEYARIGRESGHHLNHASGLSTVSACQAEAGDLAEAGRTAAAALEIAVRHGIDEHWCTAHAHLAAGLALEQHDDLEGAVAALERSVELARRGAGPVSVAWTLLHLARVLAARGEREAAAGRLAEARAVLSSARDGGLLPARVADAERRLASRSGTLATGEPLTDRELAVLRMLATALSQRDIGRELYVSLNTVKTHSRSIFRKLGVSTRSQAVERARELDLL